MRAIATRDAPDGAFFDSAARTGRDGLRSVAPVGGRRQPSRFVELILDTAFGINESGGVGIARDRRFVIVGNLLVERGSDIFGMQTVGHTSAPFHPHSVVKRSELMRHVDEAVNARSIEAAQIGDSRAEMTGVGAVGEFHFAVFFGEHPITEVESIHSWFS